MITKEDITKKAKEIGQRQAFPYSSNFIGITYKQWLIGNAIISSFEFGLQRIFDRVDAILMKLAEDELNDINS